jgi:hypothetical protein
VECCCSVHVGYAAVGCTAWPTSAARHLSGLGLCRSRAHVAGAHRGLYYKGLYVFCKAAVVVHVTVSYMHSIAASQHHAARTHTAGTHHASRRCPHCCCCCCWAPQVGGFLREHNLTHLVKDVEALYFSLSNAGDCSEQLRQQLAVEVAAASLAAGEAADARSALRSQLDKAEQKLATVVTAWEVEWLAGLKAEMANGSGLAGALGRWADGAVLCGATNRRQAFLPSCSTPYNTAACSTSERPVCAPNTLYLPRSVAKPGWGAWASRMRSSTGNSSSSTGNSSTGNSSTGNSSNSSSGSSSSGSRTWDGGRTKRKLEQQLVALQAEVVSASAK